MSWAPSTFGTITTSSLSPISVTKVMRSSSAQGESRLFTRVQSWVWPKSVFFAMSMRPCRAASLFSVLMASSRLPRMMSTFAAMSGTLACIFSLLGSKKWIIRDGLNGMSATGVGAPTANGRKKARGFRICPVCRGASDACRRAGVTASGVVGATDVASHGKHLDLGVVGDELLDRVEYLDHVRSIGGHDARADTGPAMQVEMIGLRGCDLKASPDLRDDRAHDRALRLQ